MNQRCSRIQTQLDNTLLVNLILAEDNESGPAGSGGYAISIVTGVTEAVHLRFAELDRTPASAHHAFVNAGMIWCTYMKGWLMELLAQEGIAFTIREVKNPAFIEKAMLQLQAT